MVWILIEMHGGQIEPVYISLYIILYVLIHFLQLRLPHRNNT